MTYIEFIKAVSVLPIKFKLDVGGLIRDGSPHGGLCPWAALSKTPPRITSSNKDITPDIWAAADNLEDHSPRIRKDLLEACHLQEAQ